MQYEGGQPRRVKPSRVIGISLGSGEREASAEPGMNRSDFCRFKWRPMGGPSSSSAASGGPDKVPSSRYVLRIEVTSDLIRFTIGWSVRAKPRGQGGHPVERHSSCCCLGAGEAGLSNRIQPRGTCWEDDDEILGTLFGGQRY